MKIKIKVKTIIGLFIIFLVIMAIYQLPNNRLVSNSNEYTLENLLNKTEEEQEEYICIFPWTTSNYYITKEENIKKLIENTELDKNLSENHNELDENRRMIKVRANNIIGKYYLELGKPKEAERHFNTSLKLQDSKNETWALEGLLTAYWQLGEFEKAQQLWNKSKKDNENYNNSETNKLMEEAQGIININHKELSSIGGKISLENSPLAGVIVFLNKNTYGTASMPPSLNVRRVLTDSNGQYNFNNIPPGDYVIGVAIRPKQIEGYFWPVTTNDNVEVKAGLNKVQDIKFVPLLKTNQPTGGKTFPYGPIEFSWKPYPKAKSYNLLWSALERDEKGKIIGGLSTGTIKTGIRGNKVIINPNEINSLGESVISDDKGVLPTSIMGRISPGGIYSWAVEAYDEKGKLIGSSKGNYLNGIKNIPILKIDDKLAPMGDKYAYKRDYLKALQLYLEEKKANPNNIFILERLRRIYQYGFGTIKPKHNKATIYQSKIYQITKSDGDYLKLIDALIRSGENEKAKEMLLALEQSEKAGYFDYHSLGLIYAREGNWQKAREYFIKSVKDPKSDGFSTNSLVVVSLIIGDNKEALKVAKSYPYKYGSKEYLEPLKEYINISEKNPQFIRGLKVLINKESGKHPSNELYDLYIKLPKGVEKELLLYLTKFSDSSFPEKID